MQLLVYDSETTMTDFLPFLWSLLFIPCTLALFTDTRLTSILYTGPSELKASHLVLSCQGTNLTLGLYQDRSKALEIQRPRSNMWPPCLEPVTLYSLLNMTLHTACQSTNLRRGIADKFTLRLKRLLSDCYDFVTNFTRMLPCKQTFTAMAKKAHRTVHHT